jgi:hypothetical protein
MSEGLPSRSARRSPVVTADSPCTEDLPGVVYEHHGGDLSDPQGDLLASACAVRPPRLLTRAKRTSAAVRSPRAPILATGPPAGLCRLRPPRMKKPAPPCDTGFVVARWSDWGLTDAAGRTKQARGQRGNPCDRPIGGTATGRRARTAQGKRKVAENGEKNQKRSVSVRQVHRIGPRQIGGKKLLACFLRPTRPVDLGLPLPVDRRLLHRSSFSFPPAPTSVTGYHNPGVAPRDRDHRCPERVARFRADEEPEGELAFRLGARIQDAGNQEAHGKPTLRRPRERVWYASGAGW